MEKNKQEYSEINSVLKTLDSMRKEAIENKQYGFDDDWKMFMKKMRILTPQSSGSRIQNYIFRALGWTKISALLNKGDVKNTLNQYYEVKVTTVTTSNPTANIVQIRLWQKISGHHIFVIDSTKDYELIHFQLSKSEMKKEVELCGSSAHGTTEANKDNKKVEWAIHINWKKDDSVYKRWMEDYYQDTDIMEQKKKGNGKNNGVKPNSPHD